MARDDGNSTELATVVMKSRIFKGLAVFWLALCVAGNAWGITLEEAARKAAKQYDGKVLSARTVRRQGKRIHEIKLVTRKGVVKTVRIPEGRN